MANTSTYAPGNQFERIQAPPYYQANNRPFWPSLAWSASMTLAADDPLHITRPVVQPAMVPTLFFDGEVDGLLINSISVQYTGAQSSANALFIYELYDAKYYCIGAIALPVVASSAWPQPVYLLDTEDEVVTDSFGQPVTVTSVLGQGDPGAMPNPGVLLGAGTLRYALRLMESESIYLGIAQELTTPIVVSAWGQRYSRLEKVAASLGAE